MLHILFCLLFFSTAIVCEDITTSFVSLVQILLSAALYPILMIYCIYILTSRDGPTDCFQLPNIMHNCGINSAHFFLLAYGFAGSESFYIFNFIKYCQIIFQNGSLNLFFFHWCMIVFILSHAR